MDVQSIENGIRNASIDDNDEDDFLQVLKKGTKAATSNITKDQLERLITYSEKSSTAKNLLELLINDTDSFLMGLYVLGDVKGVVLFNALLINKSGKELMLNLLSTIRIRLKNDFIDKSKLDYQLEKYLISIYLNVISRFSISNPQHLQVFLALINPIHFADHDTTIYKEISRIVLLIVIKYLTIDKDTSTEIIQDFLEIIYEETTLTTSQFINLIDVLELLFPVIPEVISSIYVHDQIKTHIMVEISKLFNKGDEYALSLPINRLKIIHLLKLINSSCITEGCRTFNASHYVSLLKLGMEFGSDKEIQILSVLDLIKLWNFIQLENQKVDDSKLNIKTEDLTFILTSYLRTEYKGDRNSIIEHCIEGLAYLTLNVSVKENFRSDETIIENLISLLELNTQSKPSETFQNEGFNSSLAYGLLLIFTNLTKLTDPNMKNNDKSTLKFLKEYSNAGTRQSNVSEDQASIKLFNKALLFDHKIVSNISKLKIANIESESGAKSKMNNLIPLTINIILMIATTSEKKVKEELVKQGALNLILNCLVKYSTVIKGTVNETRPVNESPEIIETRVEAIRALAKILISVNPMLAFDKYDVKTCVPFLVELLGPDISKYSESSTLSPSVGQYPYLLEMSLIDKYEGLLALTNVSSITTNSDIRNHIIASTFDQHLNNLLLDGDNPHVQRGTWELLSNLILEPRLLAKFFNIDDGGETSNENLNRLKILIKLLNSEDLSLQVTIGGLLANSTEHEVISNILVANETIRSDLFRTICIISEEQPQDDELILRIGFVLLNLVYAARENPTFHNWIMQSDYVKRSVTSIIRENKSQEILDVFIEIARVGGGAK
ncbi:myosin-binding striated muscle assembly central-domain-containing protein [Scheffersomyces coipomensis]|uniref:myosin-binding striated muscle assembly central-domain-containing protein n=1 Tax=Scheffersomyces coipomensis TaxID=1788519 RepID=UPI00315D44C9